MPTLAIGAIVAGVGGAMQASSQKKAAKRAAQMAQFNPWNIQSGPLGHVSFQDGRINMNDSDANWHARNSLNDLRQLGFGNAQFGPGRQMMALGAGAAPAAFQGAWDAAGQMPVDAFGQFGGLAGGQAAALSNAGFNALGNTDFSGLMNQQIDAARQLARPMEERAVNSKFQNLFNRGALSSTGGNRQVADLAQAQEAADIQRVQGAQSFANMLGQQNRQFGMAALGQGLAAGQQGLQSQIGLSDMINSRAQQRMRSAFQMFQFGDSAVNSAMGRAMQAQQGTGDLDQRLRQLAALGGNMGSAQASAGAAAGNILMNNGGGASPFGSFLSGMGSGLMSGGFGGFGGGAAAGATSMGGGGFGNFGTSGFGSYNPFASMSFGG